MSPATTFSRFWNVSPATLDELRREFDSAIGAVSRSVRESVGSQMPLALWEDDDRAILEFEVPGMSQDDLDVQIDAGILTVTGKRAVPDRSGKLRHNEHCYGEFRRRVRLDESLDPSAVTAELENGLLTLTILRRVDAQPVRIAVRHRDHAASDASMDSQTAALPDSSETSSDTAE